MTPETADRPDAEIRAVGRYVLTYSLVIEALRWRVQAMRSGLDDKPPIDVSELRPRELVEAFIDLTLRYKDDLRIHALLESLRTELTDVITVRDTQSHDDWLVDYARIDPHIGVEARLQPTLKHLDVDRLNTASDRFEALERVLRMWMHAISPLTGELGASPYFKIVNGQVRC